MPERELPEEIRKQAENRETQELSPEVLEMVMEKIMDINEPGIAFSAISKGKIEKAGGLARIFHNGLLGDARSLNDEEYINTKKQNWAKKTREKRNTAVYFNITGRSTHHDPNVDMSQIAQTAHSLGEFIGPQSVVILFDPGKYKELIVTGKKLHEGPTGFFVADDPEYRGDFGGLDPEKLQELARSKGRPTNVDYEYGFKLFHRVSPRNFTGVLVKPFVSKVETGQVPDLLHRTALMVNLQPGTTEYEEYISERAEEFGAEDLDPLAEQKEAQKVVAAMREASSNPERLIPIYGIRGNLLWPKQMSYEEVKKFVARNKAAEMDSRSSPE